MCVGYSSEPIPGSEVMRRGRQQKPRMRYVIDLETAGWIVRIFEWFAYEKRSMQWIARELTHWGLLKITAPRLAAGTLNTCDGS